jgi:alpha-glucosidase
VSGSDDWWRDAVIYQVYVRSFADADGDGVGDLPGIRSRLPYLRDLGVDALWVTPFYPSPMADGGYDVADYRDVDPMFGSLDDAEALIRDAHDAGLRLIVDIVPNHTSDQHAWFRAALAAGPGSPERSRYVFRAGRGPGGSEPPTDWQSAFGGSAWQRVPDGEWYLHLFAPEQPDLNWENPEVIEEFHEVLRFWLDRGVDGFRIDVANALKKDQSFPDVGHTEENLLAPVEGPYHPFWDRDGVHEIYRGWRRVINEYGDDRIFVAEAWVHSPERLACYVRPDELHTAFNFAFLQTSWSAERMRPVIDSCLATTAAVGAPTTWVLSNHDVTRHPTRYARLGDTAPPGGERHVEPHVPLDLDQGLRRARAAVLLMLALPGSAYIYEGEELGLQEVLDLPDDVLQDPVWERSGHKERGRDGCRVPIPWSVDGPSLGFGAGAPWLPQPASWAALSVQAQTGAEGSVLELYRAALRLRREQPALGGGDIRWLDSPDGALLFERTDGRGATMLCAVNLSATPVSLPPGHRVFLASGPLGPAGELAPDTAAWLQPAQSRGESK